MSDPLLVNDLEDEELRDQFNLLLEAMEDITTFDPDREEGSYEALNHRIHQEVTEQPILARIVTDRGESLLSMACSNLNLESSHSVIKCLIQAYPSALLLTLTNNRDNLYTNVPIYMIVRHPEHCVLMPWIATNYSWILDHERRRPLVSDLLDMLDRYSERRRNSCTSAILKQFVEAYPPALTQKDYGDNVLHMILQGTKECDADLFKWMAERCPSSLLLDTNPNDFTPLHHACYHLSMKLGRDSSEICKYLIQKCPASVQMTGKKKNLPIHLLHDSCQYRAVREVVVCLVREYPESIDKRPYGHHLPSSIPFIQSIKPFLDEEKELRETAASLKDSNSFLTDAVTCTNDQLMRSAFAVFDSWATSFINTTEDKLQLISTQLQDMCNEGRGSNE